MQDLSMHILDVAENSIRAGASRVVIRLEENTAQDLLRLEITDNGSGMNNQVCARAMSPFESSRPERRIGLGLALLRQATRQAGGDCRITSTPQKGTHVQATFQHSHIDRKPLGDLIETMMTLGVGRPDINFVLEVWRDGVQRHLETKQISAQLGAAPLVSPQGLSTLRTRLSEVLADAPARESESIGSESDIDQGA